MAVRRPFAFALVLECFQAYMKKPNNPEVVASTVCTGRGSRTAAVEQGSGRIDLKSKVSGQAAPYHIANSTAGRPEHPPLKRRKASRSPRNKK